LHLDVVWGQSGAGGTCRDLKVSDVHTTLSGTLHEARIPRCDSVYLAALSYPLGILCWRHSSDGVRLATRLPTFEIHSVHSISVFTIALLTGDPTVATYSAHKSIRILSRAILFIALSPISGGSRLRKPIPVGCRCAIRSP